MKIIKVKITITAKEVHGWIGAKEKIGVYPSPMRCTRSPQSNSVSEFHFRVM